MPNVVQVPVNIQLQTVRQAFLGDVGQPAVAINHAIAGKIKAVFHPPLRPISPIMVATNQNFPARQGVEYLLDKRPLTDSYVTEMDYHIVCFDGSLPVFYQNFCEVRWPLAVGSDILVIEMRVCN